MMRLEKGIVYLPQQTSDPYLNQECWAEIVAEIKQKFPGQNVIRYQVNDSYTSLVSLSGELDPEALAGEYAAMSIMVTGSQHKVDFTVLDESDLILQGRYHPLENNIDPEVYGDNYE